MLPFYALLLAHLAADFLQPAALVELARRSPRGLALHIGIYSALNLLVLFAYGPLWPVFLVLLAIQHYALDRGKHLLAVRRIEGVHIFLADQALHVGAIALIAFVGLAGARPSPFLQLISPYWYLLPVITAYAVVTFAVSILSFETARTLVPDPVGEFGDDIANSRHRLPGMLERAAAVSLLLARVWFLAPFAFTLSTYRLFTAPSGNSRRRQGIELAVSVGSAVAIGAALILR